jgi:UDP-2,3-diacylglucosamine hydrolase
MGEPRDERAVFFSDVHISPERPETTAALIAFLDRLASERVARVFCLGDLFNFWVGRGHERLAGYREVVERLAALRASGAEIAIVHGNRDFHIGDEVARAAGATVIPEGATVRLGGRVLHLAHGDRLCLRDTSYQAMRRIVRSRAARRGFLALPLEARLGVGRAFRQQSRRSVATKAARRPRAFALAPCAVRRLFRGDVDTAIVGHVHHARRIALAVAGRPRVLFTLGSWDDGNRSWLELAGGKFTLYDGPHAERTLVER